MEYIMQNCNIILLVDDDDIVGRILSEMLKNLGFDVLSAENGKKAVEIYKEYEDEIVSTILDIIYPRWLV